MSENETMIIAVDFDGTICGNAFPEIGPDLGGAFYLWQAKNLGCQLILWTCRVEERLGAALNWLDANGYDGLFDAINDHAPGTTEWWKGPPSRKAFAHIYVDDRNLGAPFKHYHDPDRPDHFDWRTAGPKLIEEIGRRIKAQNS